MFLRVFAARGKGRFHRVCMRSLGIANDTFVVQDRNSGISNVGANALKDGLKINSCLTRLDLVSAGVAMVL